MNKDFLIEVLIRKTYYIGEILLVDIDEETKKELFKQGYFKDDLLAKISSKGNDILKEYYYHYKDDLIKFLFKASGSTTVDDIIKHLNINGNWRHIKFLMKRLEGEEIIILSASTDWDKKIKYKMK